MKKGLSRRNLFKYMGATGATAVAAGCDVGPEKLIPMLVPPNAFEYTPYTAYQYMTTCRECDAACGMMVTVRENRAQKAEGNPFHPFNQGALCARGQASMQTLYNPHRIKSPLDASGNPLTWEQAESTFVEKLKTASGKVAYLGRPESGTAQNFIKDWLAAIGGGNSVSFELLGRSSQKTANEISFGRADIPDYRFEDAKIIINFGADFMETWGNPVENTRRFTQMHAHKEGHKKQKLIHISPHVSLTGAKAEEWVILNPGTEGLLALAMAYAIRKEKGSYPFLADYLSAYAPEGVAEKTGVSAKRIYELASEFSHNTPGLALGGSSITASEHGTETLVAINVLNAVAGNLGKTVRFFEKSYSSGSLEQVWTLLKDMTEGKINVLIVDDANPLHALPESAGVAAALKNTFVVSLSSAQSETAHAANLTLPALTAYETWGDANPRDGVHSIQQPVMAPVDTFDARGREDVLISVAKKINATSFASSTTYRDYLRASWKKIQAKTGHVGAFDDFWVKVLENGGSFAHSKSVSVALKNSATSVEPSAPTLEGKGLTLLVTPSLMHSEGQGANKPWLQEVPNSISQIVWDSWMEIHPDTAQSMKIPDRSVVEITTPNGSAQVTAYYQFGIHRGAVAIPMGQGHTQSGSVADGFGINVMNLISAKKDFRSGGLATLTTQAELKLVTNLSYTVRLDGNPRQLGRNIAAATTVTALANGTAYTPHHGRPKEVTEFYPPRSETAGYYKPYRWGMVVDLDRCNGCSACVVACYSENNIPVVGKMRAAVGREMSWIRVERYIEGYGDEFETRVVPIMCQQCSNAGCEPVCPVYATYHTPEGINAMIYNRCVGTRYCSNNCMYKARRFNWFNYEYQAPLHQQLNSTITTRSVGVMEKCNFCYHRLTAAKNEAMDLGRDLRDGEVTTACQQTCPTQAITFGNLVDSESKVSQLAKRDNPHDRDRQYEIMPEINFKPAVTYLKKVNTRSGAPDAHGAAPAQGGHGAAPVHAGHGKHAHARH